LRIDPKVSLPGWTPVDSRNRAAPDSQTLTVT
jgi:hypothetical protein